MLYWIYATELNIGAKLESPKSIESMPGVPLERPSLNLEKPEKASEKSRRSPECRRCRAVRRAFKKRNLGIWRAGKADWEFFGARLGRNLSRLALNKQVEFRKEGEETARK